MRAFAPKNIADPSYLLRRDVQTEPPKASVQLRDLHRFWDEAPRWRTNSGVSIRRWLGDPVSTATISVVVVTWQKAPCPRRCLESLQEACSRVDADVEIIVVDNAGDTNPEAYQGLWDRWVGLSENLGPGPARNLGAEIASGEILAFVDDDGVVDDDYFKNALPYFCDPHIVGIRGRITPVHHHYFSALASHYDRGPDPLEDALITEGASFVRRASFLAVDGFPFGIFGHEGLELTYRLTSLHPQVTTVYCPDVVLHHDYLTGWGEFFRKARRNAKCEERVEHRDPGAAAYLKEYFRRTFPRRRLPPSQEITRQLLRLLRAALATIGTPR